MRGWLEWHGSPLLPHSLLLSAQVFFSLSILSFSSSCVSLLFLFLLHFLLLFSPFYFYWLEFQVKICRFWKCFSSSWSSTISGKFFLHFFCGYASFYSIAFVYQASLWIFVDGYCESSISSKSLVLLFH